MANNIDIVLNLKGLNTVLSGFKSLSSALGSLHAQVGVGLSVAAFVAFEKHVLDNADAMGNAAQQAGMTTEQFTALAYAARLSDVSAGELILAIRYLGEEMAKTGRGGASVEGELLKLADRFADMPDGVEKTNLAIDKFGRSGQTMIPLLNQGAEGIRKQLAEAQRYGAVIGGDTAKAAEEFNDQLTRIKFSTEGAGLALADVLLPDLKRLADWLGDATVKVREQGTALHALVNLYKSAAGGVALLKYSWDLDSKGFQERLAQIRAIGQPGPDILPDWVKQGKTTNPDNRTEAFTKANLDAEIEQRRREINDAKLELESLNLDRSLNPAGNRFGGAEGDLHPEDVAAATAKWTQRLEVYDQIKTKLAEMTQLYFTQQEKGIIPLNQALDHQYKLQTEINGVDKEQQAAQKEYWQALEQQFKDEIAYMQRIFQLDKEELAAEREKIQLTREYMLLANEARLISSMGPPGREGLAGRQSALNDRMTLLKGREAELMARRDMAMAAGEGTQEAIEWQREYNQTLLETKQTEMDLYNLKRDINQRLAAGTSDMFGNMATAAKAFGREGFVAFKAFSIAKAIVDTYSAATGAYSAMASIPYVGPALATAAAAAAVAAGLANVATIAAMQPSGYAEGGFTGRGGKYDVAGLVHRGEFVFSQESVNRIGVGNLESLHRGNPLAGAGSVSDSLKFEFAMFDDRVKLERWLQESTGARRAVINIVGQEAHRF